MGGVYTHLEQAVGDSSVTSLSSCGPTRQPLLSLLTAPLTAEPGQAASIQERGHQTPPSQSYIYFRSPLQLSVSGLSS